MILHLKVKPNQRFDKIEQLADGWQARLKAPAIDGKANEHLIQFLAKTLHLPKSAIELKKGLTNKFKTLEIQAEEEFVLRILTEEASK